MRNAVYIWRNSRRRRRVGGVCFPRPATPPRFPHLFAAAVAAVVSSQFALDVLATEMPRRKKEDEALLSDKDRVPRGAANARERTRMRVLSKAFGRLKLTLPWVPPDTKLSKLDTLRLATSYISHLKCILDEEADDGGEDDDDGDEDGTSVDCGVDRKAKRKTVAADAINLVSNSAIVH